MSKKIKRKNLTKTELGRKLFKDLYRKKSNKKISTEDYIKSVRKTSKLQKKIIADKLDKKNKVTFVISLLKFQSSVLDKMVLDKINNYLDLNNLKDKVVRIQAYAADRVIAVEWSSFTEYKKHTKHIKNFYPQAQNQLVEEFINNFEGGFREAYDKIFK